jgi:hypothetical protein
VWGSGTNDVWAVGDAGTIVRWNGERWYPLTSGVNVTLNGVLASVVRASDSEIVVDAGASAAAAAPRPAFAIGGVVAADFPALRALGAYGIAVSGAIALAADPEAAARALVASGGA